MTAQTSQGVVLAISANTPATTDAAGFAALTYTTVGELTDIPEYGAETTVVTHDPLASGTTEKYKGQTNNGSSALSGALDADDAGQTIMISGAEGANKLLTHSVKITLPDGAIHYYFGKIFSFKTSVGSANAIISFSSTFEIDSVVVRVAAP